MSAQQLTRPEKQEQVAALYRLVFEANPGVRMTRSQIEKALALPLAGVSESTRQRALYVLMHHMGRGVIRCEEGGPYGSGHPSIYWMPVREGD